MTKLTAFIAELPLVDAHCHPYLYQDYDSVDDFRRAFSLTVPSMQQDAETQQAQGKPQTFLGEHIFTGLARQFDLPVPGEPDASWYQSVLDTRAEQDPASYTRGLFQDAGISHLVVDTGYPQPPVDLARYREEVGVSASELIRIEPVFNDCWSRASSLAGFQTGFQEQLDAALARSSTAGLKTIIAYRSGLDVRQPEPTAIARAWDLLNQTENLRDPQLKPLRDWAFHCALEACQTHHKPLQVHTGGGDSDILFEKAKPSLLFNVLTRPANPKPPVVLVHGGYPWNQEATYMAGVLDNVYLDVSLHCPWLGPGVESLLKDVLSFPAYTKVMWGSDAFNIPEINWIAAKLTRFWLERIAREWIDSGLVTRGFVESVLEHFTHLNAQRLYHLESN